MINRTDPMPPLDPNGLLAAIVASSQDAIISTDLSGAIMTWNQAAEQLFGYTAEEIAGRPVSILIPPDRLGDEQQLLARSRRGHRIERYDTLRRRKDGADIAVSLTISPIRDPAGRIIGASKIVRDISEREKARERLRGSEERFRVTLASIGDAVIATDVEGRVTFMNRVAEALTGWAESEARRRPLVDVFNIVDERSRQPVENPVAKVLRHGLTVGLANHTILVARDGTSRPIDDSAAPIRGEDGRLIGIVLVFRDVSEQRAAEIASLRLAAIVENSDDAIVGKDLHGIVTSWNAGAQRLFGYAPEEMVGQPITRLFPPGHEDEEASILLRLQRGERVDHFETVRVRKDGSRINVSLTISPIKDGDGNVIGASKIARDITAQKHAGEALETARRELAAHAENLEHKVRERTAQLEETIAQLNTFSYSLSHDMRAPLRSIQGFAEIVLSEFSAPLGPEGTSHLRRVISAASRLDRLIQDVLMLSRVSRQEIAVERVDLDQLVHDVISERTDLQPPQAEVTFSGSLLPIQGQVAFLTQCVTNLLDNAVKFVAPGVKPRVRLWTERRDNRVRLWVEDNGIGIAPAQEESLFGLFRRGHPEAEYPGTGVGLAIVRKAVERMNGTTGVESLPGRGSRFWIELPAAA